MAEQVLKKEKLLLNADKWQVRPSSWILAVYIALMPVSTALADLFAGPSVMTLFAGIYIMVSLCEVVFIYRRLEADIGLLPVYAYFLFTMASCLWNEYFDADWYFGQFAITTAIVLCITVKRVSVKEIKLFKLAMYISILIAVISTLMNLPKPGKRLLICQRFVCDNLTKVAGRIVIVDVRRFVQLHARERRAAVCKGYQHTVRTLGIKRTQSNKVRFFIRLRFLSFFHKFLGQRGAIRLRQFDRRGRSDWILLLDRHNRFVVFGAKELQGPNNKKRHHQNEQEI